MEQKLEDPRLLRDGLLRFGFRRPPRSFAFIWVSGWGCRVLGLGFRGLGGYVRVVHKSSWGIQWSRCVLNPKP